MNWSEKTEYWNKNTLLSAPKGMVLCQYNYPNVDSRPICFGLFINAQTYDTDLVAVWKIKEVKK